MLLLLLHEPLASALCIDSTCAAGAAAVRLLQTLTWSAVTIRSKVQPAARSGHVATLYGSSMLVFGGGLRACRAAIGSDAGVLLAAAGLLHQLLPPRLLSCIATLPSLAPADTSRIHRAIQLPHELRQAAPSPAATTTHGSWTSPQPAGAGRTCAPACPHRAQATAACASVTHGTCWAAATTSRVSPATSAEQCGHEARVNACRRACHPATCALRAHCVRERARLTADTALACRAKWLLAALPCPALPRACRLHRHAGCRPE